VTNFYFGTHQNEKFKQLESLIMEDNLFDNLKKDIPDVGEAIVLILKDDKESLKSLSILA
jgi:hypothetical protein